MGERPQSELDGDEHPSTSDWPVQLTGLEEVPEQPHASAGGSAPSMKRAPPARPAPPAATTGIEETPAAVCAIEALLVKHHGELLEHIRELARESRTAKRKDACDEPPEDERPWPRATEADVQSEVSPGSKEEEVACTRSTRRAKTAAISLICDEELADYEEAKQQQIRVEATSREDSTVGFNRHKHPLLLRIATSSWYTNFLTAAVVTNCVIIGVQVEYMALNRGSEAPEAFFVLSTIFAAIFLFELCVELGAHGFAIFVGPSWYWYWLDAFISVSSLLDVVFHFYVATSTMSASQLRVLRILRVARLARVVRVVKVAKFLRALRTLVHSIACALRSLAWALVLIVLIMYVFGILFTDTANAHLAENPPPWGAGSHEQILDSCFGTLHKSMHCLFRSITGGLNWREAADPLASISMFWAYCFTMYIAFSLFAVLNVMTAVFCQSAVESAQRDHEMAIHSIMMHKKRYEGILTDLFKHLDADSSGSITIAEFERHFEDSDVKALLHSLELEVEDARSLFLLLDQDENRDIDAAEFLDGCMNLKGTAKAIEVAKLGRRTENRFSLLAAKMETLESQHNEFAKMLRMLLEKSGH